MISFTDAEKQTALRLSVAGGWDHEDAAPLKAKIKPHLLSRTSRCCCYCRLSMHQWHGLTIDIEHVLPKADGKYPQLMFEPKNLSVACKRCNMGIKRDDTSFYIGSASEAEDFKSSHYTFVHPNLDAIDDHLSFHSQQHNNKLMVKYQVVNDSSKGKKAYEYFKLKDLEVNSFDGAQGLHDVELTDAVPPEVAKEVQACLHSISPDI
jgi:hypothetical protein